MASDAGTLEVLARELAHALEPLEQRLAAGRVDALFSSLGLRLPSGFTSQAALTAPLAAGVSAATALPPLVVQLTAAIEAEDIGQIVSSGQALLQKITEVIEAIPQISSGLDSVAAGFGGLTPAQRAEINALAQELPRRLLDMLVVEYIESRTPAGIPPTLALLGIIDNDVDPGVPDEPLRPPFVRKALHLERVPKLFSDPAAFMREVYGWGDPGFDGLKLLGNLHRFVEEFLAAPVDLLTPPGFPAILEAYLYAVRVNPETTPPGVVVDFRFPATQDFERTYPLTAPWALKVTANARFAPDLEVTITPPLDASLRPRQGTVNIDFAAGVAADSTSDPILLLGRAGGTRLEAKQVSVSAGFAASFDGATARGEPLGLVAVTGGALVVDTSDGDGFIHSLLSGANVNSTFDVKARWRPSTGIVFEGGAGIELVIPMHLNLGPVEIQQLYLRFAFTNEVPLRLEAALALGATIGPLSVSVDRIGAAGNFTFPPDRDGNLGVANLTLDFLPPPASASSSTRDRSPAAGSSRSSRRLAGMPASFSSKRWGSRSPRWVCSIRGCRTGRRASRS